MQGIAKQGVLTKKLQLTSTFEYNKELEKWVFPIGEEKQEKKKTKNKKVRNLSEEGNVHSLDKNPLTSKVKVRFELGSWSDGLAATKARSRAGSWNVDGEDEIRRP